MKGVCLLRFGCALLASAAAHALQLVFGNVWTICPTQCGKEGTQSRSQACLSPFARSRLGQSVRDSAAAKGDVQLSSAATALN